MSEVSNILASIRICLRAGRVHQFDEDEIFTSSDIFSGLCLAVDVEPAKFVEGSGLSPLTR